MLSTDIRTAMLSGQQLLVPTYVRELRHAEWEAGCLLAVGGIAQAAEDHVVAWREVLRSQLPRALEESQRLRFFHSHTATVQ